MYCELINKNKMRIRGILAKRKHQLKANKGTDWLRVFVEKNPKKFSKKIAFVFLTQIEQVKNGEDGYLGCAAATKDF
jgi:hypothetical protein